MESKEIYAVILAALGIVLVIGILSMITKSVNPEQQESIPVATDVTQMPAITLETDVWDLIREQNATTAVTEDTAESDAESGTEAAVTGDEDAALYSKGSTPEEGTSAVSEPAESDAALPVVTELPPPQEEEEQTYVIVLN